MFHRQFMLPKRRAQEVFSFIACAATLVIVMSPFGHVFAATSSTTSSTSSALSGFYSVTGGGPLTFGGIIQAIANVAKDIFAVITAIAGVFGIVYIAFGGFTMMSGGGRKKEEGVERVKYALVGLGVALCAGVLTGVAALFAGTFTSHL